MRRTSARSQPLADSEYYERLGLLQHELRDSEKRRLDLERKLYEYNHSDTCRVKLKYVKLKRYLKEIYESEKKAHTRNQEYLKSCEHVQAHIACFNTNTEKLEKLKIEYETQIKKIQLLSTGSLELNGELKDEEPKVTIQAGINFGTVMSRGLYLPPRVSSAISNTENFNAHIEDFNIKQKCTQPTKNFSFSDLQSCQQSAQKCNVLDSCTDTQCLCKCEKKDGKTSLQIGEEVPTTASVLSEGEKTHCLEIESGIHHGKKNLSESKQSAQLHSLLLERLSPQNRTTDLKYDSCHRSEESEEEILTKKHIELNEEKAGLPVSPLLISEYCASESKCTQEDHSAWEGFVDNLPHEDQKPSSKMQEDIEEKSLSSSSSDLTISLSEDDLVLQSPEPQPNPYDKLEREDGIKTLTLIHSAQERDALFTEKNNCILQSLSSPESKKESSTNSTIQKSEPSPHSNLVRAQLAQHVTTLKEDDGSLKEEATALLNKALPEECEDRSSIHSNESSCSLPSILNDNSGIKEAKLGFWLNSIRTREQEVSSSCRDETKEESVTTKIPVKGLNNGSSMFKTKATRIASEANFSSGKGNLSLRHETTRKLNTDFKSKAFWGESDDSNSEIEAALRPRNHDTSTDEFDDFYD